MPDMPDWEPEADESDDESGYPWDCDLPYEDLGNYDEEDDE
jgi:hypothetical protein